MTKRLFDILFSTLLLLLLAPLFLLIALFIYRDTRGKIFYRQPRVGKGKKEFYLYKFRTMHEGAERKGYITVGSNDNRITPSGLLLRKYKIDELPQLWNVLKGDMSVVGPRPEVKKYVDLYTPEQQQVLSIRPGITDYASIQYARENELLGKAPDPEKTYIEDIMPSKLRLNLDYIRTNGFFTDLFIIVKTIAGIFRR